MGYKCLLETPRGASRHVRRRFKSFEIVDGITVIRKAPYSGAVDVHTSVINIIMMAKMLPSIPSKHIFSRKSKKI
jgi:hypothetical protein